MDELTRKLVETVRQITQAKPAKDGDYAGVPPEQPMTDAELDAYHKQYHARKHSKKT